MSRLMDKSVLMIAFHFPPAAMSSGHLRTLGFARHLPTSGWKPIVLSARALAYPRSMPVADGLIPKDCQVERAFALDVSRHLAIAGKYPGFLAQPDRWASWWPAAVASGLRLIRRHHVKAIWSTYPIMTAHCVAHTLSRLTRLPWIADFRDPVSTSVEPGNPYSFASQHRWERRVLSNAARIVLTTPGALQSYVTSYPEAHTRNRLALIDNGYDEEAFVGLPEPARSVGRPLVFVHSGMLYPDGRNPVPFFEALSRLVGSGALQPEDVRVVLRASGSEPTYARDIERLGIGRFVTLEPPVSNRMALEEQASADALLLFQGPRFNRQIPAKVYEYLRIGRPILALIDNGGDTAEVLRRAGGARIVSMDDVDAIAAQLPEFIRDVRDGRIQGARAEVVAHYARSEGAATLAGMLDKITLGQRVHPE
ncbi:glycosyltransferase [Rhodanobacter lindaniclasticus]